jgi:hypothetical protein
MKLSEKDDNPSRQLAKEVSPISSASARRWVVCLLDDSPRGEGEKEVRCPSSTLLTLSVTIVHLLAEGQKDSIVHHVFIVHNRTGDRKEE